MADQLLGPLLVEEARQLDQNPVLALLLDRGLGDAELVDSIRDDLPRLIDGIARLGRSELRAVDLEQQIEAALEIEAQLDGLVAELGHLGEALPFLVVGGGRGTGLKDLGPLLGRQGVELEGGPQRIEGGRQADQGQE